MKILIEVELPVAKIADGDFYQYDTGFDAYKLDVLTMRGNQTLDDFVDSIVASVSGMLLDELYKEVIG